MPVTSATLLVSFPELTDAGEDLIDAKIAEAELRVGDAALWGSTAIRDLGVMYKAAHLIALSPYGAMAKLVSDKGSSTYGVQYKQLVDEVGCGFLVL
jgi:hypothetical protein